MLTIVGFLWRDPLCAAKYEPEYANIWARMIHRNLKMPHRFVLMTDQPDADYDPLIEPVRLWDDWREVRRVEHWPDGKPQCYVRLKAFSREVKAIFGERFVSIDLDCVVLDWLDPLFDRPEDFVIYRRPAEGKRMTLNCYQGSMWMMTTGCRSFVYDDFKGAESVAEAGAFMGSDQAWIRYKLGPDEAGWTTRDGVISGAAVLADNRWLAEKPPDTRIIFFHCETKPHHYLLPKRPVIDETVWQLKLKSQPQLSHLWIRDYYR